MSKKLLTISAVAAALTISTGFAHCGTCGTKKVEKKDAKKACPATAVKKEACSTKACKLNTPKCDKKKACAVKDGKVCPKKMAMVEEVLELTQAEKQYGATLEMMLGNMRKQAAANQSPQGKMIADVLERFFDKFFSYKVVKPLIVKCYVDEFTGKELKALCEFYKTDTGKMLVEKQPKVVAKMNAMVINLFQKHQGELTKMVQAEMAKMSQPTAK